jgi:hypothetical protein
VPYGPASGPGAANVGSGTAFSALVSDSTVKYAGGAFPAVAGVTSETGTRFGANCTNPVANVANVFSLQLNTNLFTTSACNGGNPGCQGWQQFVYAQSGTGTGTGTAFMQYWLANYGSPCPGGYAPFSGSCFKNSNGVGMSGQAITNLANMSLYGEAYNGTDIVEVFVSSNTVSASGADTVLNLQNHWTLTEFNIFGNSCSSQANFNAGATVGVETGVLRNANSYGAPNCSRIGLTGETNNLNLVTSSCCPVEGAGQTLNIAGLATIRFSESNAGGATAPFCLLNDITPILAPLL